MVSAVSLRLVPFVLAAVLLAGCGSSGGSTTSAKTEDDGIQQLDFGYDASAPLAFADRGRVNKSSYPIAVHDVSFTSSGKKIEAFLLVPPGEEKRPAVIFVHGAGADRTELIGPAAWLAARDVVTLTLTEPSTAHLPPPADSLARQLEQTRKVQVADVVAVRRAADLLRSRPEVDPDRIGYVGWSSGAKTGALVAAAEPHIEAFALLSAGAAPLSAFVQQAPTNMRKQVKEILGSIDPIRYIARARPGTVLLENGRQDQIVPQSALKNIVRAAPDDTVVHWYAAPHELNKAAYHDAFEWLTGKLGVTGPNVPGAATENSPG
jgi:dienelactone hydrolase